MLTRRIRQAGAIKCCTPCGSVQSTVGKFRVDDPPISQNSRHDWQLSCLAKHRPIHKCWVCRHTAKEEQRAFAQKMPGLQWINAAKVALLAEKPTLQATHRRPTMGCGETASALGISSSR